MSVAITVFYSRFIVDSPAVRLSYIDKPPSLSLFYPLSARLSSLLCYPLYAPIAVRLLYYLYYNSLSLITKPALPVVRLYQI